MKRKDIEKILYDIRFHPKKRMEIFMSLPNELRASVVLRLSKHIQLDLLPKIKTVELIAIFEHLDSDEVTDMVQNMKPRRQKEIVSRLSERLKSEVLTLAEFDPDTAAGLMNLDYIQVDEDETITSAIQQCRTHEKRTGKWPAILVMRSGRLVGYLPEHQLALAGNSTLVKKYIKHIYSIKQSAKKDEIVHLFQTHPHHKIAVLGNAGNVVGIIYSDDILKLLAQRPSASLYDFAGVADEESVSDSARRKITYRYKWLIINLATAFLAAFTVSLFDKTISKYVLLAVYMPIVAGMGGNAGTQTLAVLVRGIALKQIELKTALPTLRRELGAGLVNGCINGLIVASVVVFFNHDLKLALVLGFAMIFNLVVAAFFGTMIPLVMKKFGKDPATSATIFITTATDVLGFLAFLGVATLIL